MDRTGFLGASDFGALLGLSKWCSPKQLWAEKTGLAPARPSSLRLEVGNALEEFVLTKWREGAKPIEWKRKVEHRHSTEEWLRSHPDMLAILTDGEREETALVEAKTCAFAKRDDGWGKAGTAEIPAGYFAQVQVQMLCARSCGELARRTFVPCLLLNRLGDENNPQIFEVPYDEEIALGLLEKGREFWRRVETKTWPEEENESEAA